MASTPITLALQGGGAHGAFTWGVLDRLLEAPQLAITGISGTSAGAINACLLAQGLRRGGAAGAQAELAAFWRRLSELGTAAFNPYRTTPYNALTRSWNLDWSPAALWLDVMAQFVSPYQLNPLDHNPLREVLRECLDFDQLRAEGTVPLFVCATSLTTNRMRVFTKQDLSLDALLASACLPQLHRAVEIDAEFYWDGGFIGNPVLKPLLHLGTAQDLVLVLLNPMQRAELPISARDILDRLNEVTMNAALMRELEGIAVINRLIEAGQLQHPRYVVIRLHAIADPAVMTGLGLSSKSNTAWPFLTYLHAAGREAAAAWLAEHGAALGRSSTLDPAAFAL